MRPPSSSTRRRGRGPALSRSTRRVIPATASRTNDLVTLTNGLVSVTLDPAHGGAISALSISSRPNLLSTFGDDVVYWNDTAALHIPTTLEAETRTDDLGFAAFTHPVDNRPIAPGDRTYRRDIFYPVTYWSDVSDASGGLTLITHGLQGVGGTSNLSLLLVRQVTEDNEGVTDPDYHTLRYAYLPHAGQVANPSTSLREASTWDRASLPEMAYAFNQPLIPVWRSGSQICVQLPFLTQSPICNLQSPITNLPASLSLPSP